MQIYYLEIVTKEVGAVCASYAAANGVSLVRLTPDSATHWADTRAGGWVVGRRS